MITNNYQNQLNYGAVKDVIPQQVSQKLPQNIQNYDVKQQVEENPALKAAQNANFDPLTIGLTGAIWLGFSQVCQLLNNKLNCDWDKSWLGKIGNKAENIAKKHIKNNGNNRLKNFISNIFNKSDILRSLKTPTMPQNSMAINQARGITGYVMSDVSSMLGYHLKNGHKDDILNLVKGLNGFKGQTGEEALKYIDDLFKNCEQNQPQIKELIKRLSNSDVKVSVDNLVNGKIIKIPNIPFLKRNGSFKEMANKLNAVFSNSPKLGDQVTNLGKSLPKQALKTLEGLTNGGAGGKLLIVIQASIFAQAIKKAMDAPKGEKLSTFSENIANDFGFFLSLPLQVKSTHILGGLKYIGINGAKNTTEQAQNVTTYRNMIKNLNSKIDAGTISHIDYLKESKKIKDYLKGDSKWYQKPLKLLGKIFSTGLDAETVKPFIDNTDKSLGTAVFNKVKSIANKIKGPGLGTVLRFAIGTMIVGPAIAKITTKISHLIFGRPTKSILDKEESENKTDNKQKDKLNMTQEEMMQKLAANPELIKKMENDPQFLNELLGNPDLMAKYLNGEIKIENNKQNSDLINSKYIIDKTNTITQKPNTPVQVQQGLKAIDNDSQNKMDLFGLGNKKQENSAQEETSAQDSLEPVRTYIPSSQPAIMANEETQELDSDVNSALLKAQKAEEAALKQLSNL